MGCQHSSVAVEPPRKMSERPSTLRVPPFYSGDYEIDPEELLKFDLRMILNKIKKIPRPKYIHPIACIGEMSNPLILEKVIIDEDQNPIEVIFPAIGFARLEMGRVLCLGSFEILALCDESDENYVLFIENLLRWAGGPNPMVRNALVSNGIGEYSDDILFNLRGLGYALEIMKDNMVIDYTKYSFLIVESAFQNTDGMVDFLINGGGLIVAPSPTDAKNRFNINSVISQAGIAFPIHDLGYVHHAIDTSRNRIDQNLKKLNEQQYEQEDNEEFFDIKNDQNNPGIESVEIENDTNEINGNNEKENLNEDLNGNEINASSAQNLNENLKQNDNEHSENNKDEIFNYIATTKFDDLRKFTFISLLKNPLDCINSANKKKISQQDFLEKIDSMLSSIRLDIELLNRGQCGQLSYLCDSILTYLNNSEYEKDGTICTEPLQAMLAMIVTESFLKMESNELGQFDLGQIFPGVTHQYTEEASIHVTLKSNKWYSSGLWLPPNVISFVSFPKYADDIFIQVGSHTEFIARPGPWKRWPSVVLTFEVTRPQIEIATPYGGMVYFFMKKPVTEKKPIKFRACFTDACLCPFYSVYNQAKWSKTLDNQVPWAEIQTKYAIFTVPTNIAKSNPKLDDFSILIDDLIMQVNRVFGVQNEDQQYRIVFDVEFPKEGYICGYPIIMNIDFAAPLFESNEPTSELFMLLTIIGLHCIHEGSLEHRFESALASAASGYAFIQKWSNINPTDYSQNKSRLFKNLFHILVKNGPNIFQTTNLSLKDSRNAQHMTRSRGTKYFLKCLSTVTNEDLKSLLNDESDIALDMFLISLGDSELK